MPGESEIPQHTLISNREQRWLVFTFKIRKYPSNFLEMHSSILPYFQMLFILQHFHSFNKYLSNAYTVHVLDLGHVQQESCRICPPRAHIPTEGRHSTNYATV